MTAAIHLIEKNDFIKLIDKSKNEYESGWWKVSAINAEKLIGGDIFFHHSKSSPSHFGGKIISYRIEQNGEYAGKVIFKFMFSPIYKGVVSSDGWAMEKKYIWCK